ncbi:hypothetical protein BH20GEM1_BH20GEM1_13110 [soil metagenome]
MIRPNAILLLLLYAGTGCGDSPVAGPPAALPLVPVQAVVTGLVTDPGGNPVVGARVHVSAICFIEPYQGCPMETTSTTTNTEGTFLVRFEYELPSSRPVEMTLEVLPPLGMGYVLGKTTMEDLEGRYQLPPSSDTTSVRVVLPPNSVDSRRPIRVELGNHRVGDLRADAERFYMSGPGGVGAVNPATGDRLWVRGSLNGLAGPRYALLGDRVVIAGATGLSVVRAADGELLWSREDVPNQTISASVPGGLFTSENDVVMAFDPPTGATLWSKELIGSGNVALAANADLVCAEILAYVECWHPATGDPAWARATDFGAWLAIGGGVVILGSATLQMAMNTESGEVVWEVSIGASSPPVFSEDEEHAFACSDSECIAIRTADGGIAWRVSFEDSVSEPAVEGGLLYVRAGVPPGPTSLYVLDAMSGATQERILPDPFDTGFCGAPAVTAEHLAVIGCGSFYMFERP